MDSESLLPKLGPGVHHDHVQAGKPHHQFDVDIDFFPLKNRQRKPFEKIEQHLKAVHASINRSGPAHVYRSVPARAQSLSRFDGWRGGLLFTTAASGVCFCLEVAFLIYVSIQSPRVASTGILSSSSCSHVKYLNNILLIPINIIGTVIIASGNYLMQCLVAPSRSEVDTAHATGEFLHVGILSLRNTEYIAKRKRVNFFLIFLLSLPVHLLLNSVIFTAAGVNNYGVLVVSADFVEDPTWDKCADLLSAPQHFDSIAWVCSMKYKIANNDKSFSQLDKYSCIQRYSDSLNPTTGNLVLVTNATGGARWSTIANNTSGLPLRFASNFDYGSFAVNGRNDLTFLVGDYDTYGGLFVESDPDKACLPYCAGISNTSLVTLEGLGYNTEQNHTYDVTDPLWNISSVRSIWTAFDYQFWVFGQRLFWNFSSPEISSSKIWQPSSWICDADYIASGEQCTSNAALTNVTSWKVTPNHLEVDHCISETVNDHCELQYSFIIVIILVFVELCKLAVLLYTGYRVAFKRNRNEYQYEPLITVGDAVASFLRQPSQVTQNRCLADLDFVIMQHYKNFKPAANKLWNRPDPGPTIPTRIPDIAKALYTSAPLLWMPQSKRWRNIPSKYRWRIFGLLSIAILGAAVAFWLFCMIRLEENHTLDMWAQPLGDINSWTLFANTGDGPSGRGRMSSGNQQDATSDIDLRAVMKINSPQLLFSTLYFAYNTIFSAMMAAREWGQFVTFKNGRTLRVSRPAGQQRSTYWLSLPWTYSLPLAAVSALMHWLLSRSLFILELLTYDQNGVRQANRDILGIGYSPLATLLVILLLVLVLLVILYVGNWKLPSGIPVVGTNSRAISAACHHTASGEDEDVALGPLFWGVTDPGEGTEEKPGHCSLTGHPVEKPIPGHYYA